MLDTGQAQQLARSVLKALTTEYPHHVQHLFADVHDTATPATTHPAFHSSYDWHSCVHMHWSLVRLLNRFALNELRAPLDHALTVEKILAEKRYFEANGRASFSRPYGWAWLLKLDAELSLCAHPRAPAWRAALQPLAQFLAQSLLGYLQKLSTPIRHGVHTNTAFACVLALQWARLNQHDELADIISMRAAQWFGEDAAHGVFWEPSGSDFLSPTLTEALLMSQLLTGQAFTTWWTAYMPIALDETPLAHQPNISDRCDPQIVHLDGLNLSRAWCARGILNSLPLDHESRVPLQKIFRAGLAVSAPQVFDGDFVATHWLASFLLLAETEFESGM